MEHWTREESDKRWEENETRLSAMRLDDLEAELVANKAKEATIVEGIREDRNYAEMPRALAREQANLAMGKMDTMIQRMGLNRHIRDKREAIRS